MADTSYRVWFGCRINGVEYERGQLVTLDSANPGVQAALNHPGAPRIRVNDGGAGGTPDDNSVTNVKVAADADIAVSKLAAGTDGQVLTTSGSTPTWGAAASGGSTSDVLLLMGG